ncbi:hypothetical protein [Streptomyces sp. NPDC059003]|uniref:terpene synthase family protein n=1 Tax=Streptomyces sp. NPDC059003 TaxID=3346691 RepID=UPI00369A680B
MPAFLRLEEYRLPDVFYPGDSCRYAENTVRQFDRWCRELTHLSPQAREQVVSMEMGYATVHCHPHSTSPERALACALHLLWTTLFDDYFGICEPTRLTRTQDRVVSILRGSPEQPTDHPLVHKVAQLRDLCLSLAPPGWFDRYIRSVEGYFYKGLTTESALRRERRIPTFAELERFRPHTIVQIPYQRMVEIELNLGLPEDIITHPVIARAEHLVARLAAWQNDAFSLMKELARPAEVGDVINLALVLQHERGLTLEDACTAMLEVYTADVQELLHLYEHLPSFGQHQEAVRNYVRHLAYTVSGLETWYLAHGSARYLPDGNWVDEYAP